MSMAKDVLPASFTLHILYLFKCVLFVSITPYLLNDSLKTGFVTISINNNRMKQVSFEKPSAQILHVYASIYY